MQHFDWTALVSDEITEVSPAERPKIKADYERSTRWFREQPGFGLREYASGRRVYIVKFQTPTGDRTVTIGNASVVDRVTALDVARRCIYHSDPDRNVADERKRIRRAPLCQPGRAPVPTRRKRRPRKHPVDTRSHGHATG